MVGEYGFSVSRSHEVFKHHIVGEQDVQDSLKLAYLLERRPVDATETLL